MYLLISVRFLRYVVCNLPIDGYQSRIEVFFSFRNLFFKFFNPIRSIFNEFFTVQPNFSWNPHHFFVRESNIVH